MPEVWTVICPLEDGFTVIASEIKFGSLYITGTILRQELELKIRGGGAECCGFGGGRLVVITGEVVVVNCTNLVKVGVCCIEFSEVVEVKLVRVEVLE